MNWKDFKTKFLKSRLAVTIWLLLGLIGLAALFRNILSWNGWFTSLIQAGITVDPKTQSISVHGWLFWISAILVAALVAVGGLLLRSEFNLSEIVKVKNERGTIAFKTMERMMWAATRIRDQHHPQAVKARKSIRKGEMTFRLDKNFGAQVEQKWDIYTTEESVNFWSISIRATAEATRMEYLDDINFKIRDESGNNVVYMPVENDPLMKKLVVYFLPQIEPKTQDRKIVWTYEWPGLFKQLQLKESENFNYSIDSLNPLESMKLVFLLEKGTGCDLICDNLGPDYEGKPEQISDDDHAGFSYTMKNLPAGKCSIGLLLKLKRP